MQVEAWRRCGCPASRIPPVQAEQGAGQRRERDGDMPAVRHWLDVGLVEFVHAATALSLASYGFAFWSKSPMSSSWVRY